MQVRVGAPAVVVSLAALAALVALAVTGPTDAVRSVRAATAVSAPPAEIVATVAGRLVVLSSADGHVERTIAGDPAAYQSATTVSPTPDGSTVYFTVGEQCGGRTPQIFRVRSDGAGEPELAAAVGMDPLVSPDGHSLAYVTSSALEPGDCGPFDTLVVRDLSSGTERRLDFGQNVGGLAPLAWTPHSARIATTGWFDHGPGVAATFIEVSDGGLAVGAKLAFQGGGGSTLAGNGYAFLPSGEPITAFPTDLASRVATFDPRTGEARRTIVAVPRPLYLAAADASGTDFLFDGPLGDTADGHDLVRAGVDDPTPVQLASHVTSAAWLPAPPSPPVTTTTSAPAPPTATSTSSTTSTTMSGHPMDAPRLAVVWTDDFKVEVIDATTAAVLRVRSSRRGWIGRSGGISCLRVDFSLPGR